MTTKNSLLPQKSPSLCIGIDLSQDPKTRGRGTVGGGQGSMLGFKSAHAIVELLLERCSGSKIEDRRVEETGTKQVGNM